ncbi:MAG: hypothetical protein NT028_15235 [candidate division Zixibacteria bacterium]|nr:hypothetical protein [candidate division Zixibacteria bacterium]
MPKKKKEQHFRLRAVTAPDPLHDGLKSAASILQYSQESSAALLKAFEMTRSERGAQRGMTTDEEQDLLRAMLTIAAAGLDAMLKQVIRDTMPVLVQKDHGVSEELQKFVAREIRGEDVAVQSSSSVKFLARVLSAPKTQVQVIEEYINELTRGSLQSVDELSRTITALQVDRKDVGIDDKIFKTIFQIRNKIIHEMDIELSGTRRKRNLRKAPDMVKYADSLLSISESILGKVNEKLLGQ